jgi:23S rRNA U2552 (ribose-2'-O)-methylase RlmE/FtsJ
MDYFPWNTLVFFKRIDDNLTGHFELVSNTVDHSTTAEERELHRCRDKIAEYETKIKNGKNWEYYKKIVNPFEIVYTPKKYDNFPDSICVLKPLSRSYFKMIEMLDLIDFFKPLVCNGRRIIDSAHVCEGPGGFIEALLDESAKHECTVTQSVAMTLHSDKNNIPGWRRASHFLKKNKNVHVIYGNGTGDIMKTENQQYFIDYADKAAIFTADGGFDFSCDYTKQEQLIFPLLIASTRIGLEVIEKGGVFILKLIDFYCKATIDLLYILSIHFDEWTLYKPGISRPCNPEYYFIGKGFIGCCDEVLDVFRLWCSYIENNQPLGSLYKKEYAPEFIEIIRKLQEHSFHSQIQYLESVFYLISQNNDAIITTHLKSNEKMSYQWCMRFRMPIYQERTRSIEE